MNAGGGEDIDSATEEIFKVLAKADQVEQGSIAIHVHEKIQIAGRAGLPAGLGSEDTNVLGPVFLGDPQDVRAAKFEVCHRIQPQHRLTHGRAGSQKPGDSGQAQQTRHLRQAFSFLRIHSIKASALFGPRPGDVSRSATT
jgi:hypothetical protein